MTRPRHRRALVRALPLVTVAILLVGCSDDGAPSSGGSGTSAPSEESTTSGDPTSEPASEPTSKPTSEPTGPAAASGPLMEYEVVSMRAPEGFTVDTAMTPFDVSASGRTAGGAASVSAFVFTDSDGPGTSLEATVDFISTDFEAERVVYDPVEVDGIRLAHVRDPSGTRVTDVYGGEVGGSDVTLTFIFGVKSQEPERQALMAEVLASVDWQV